MGNKQLKVKIQKQTFNPNKDTLIHCFGYLPLKECLRNSILSEDFYQIISSDEMCNELIKIHHLYIVQNNRIYQSSKDKILRNVTYQKDVLFVPEWNEHWEKYSEELYAKKREQYILPSVELMEKVISVLSEGYEYFLQFKYYSTSCKSNLLDVSEQRLKKTIQDFTDLANSRNFIDFYSFNLQKLALKMNAFGWTDDINILESSYYEIQNLPTLSRFIHRIVVKEDIILKDIDIRSSYLSYDYPTLKVHLCIRKGLNLMLTGDSPGVVFGDLDFDEVVQYILKNQRKGFDIPQKSFIKLKLSSLLTDVNN